jgi:mannosyl-3-phosphoglycerate phosphatase
VRHLKLNPDNVTMEANLKTVVFTDLDGTLLESGTFSFRPAVPALDRLRELHIPVVFVTSKTLPEVDFWRRALGNSSPFAVENGSAVFVPQGNPPLSERTGRFSDGYEMVELGVPYPDLTFALKGAARESGCCIRGFADMTAEEITLECEMPLEQAVLAKMRQYDEPFRLLKGDPDVLGRALERRGLKLSSGGRFFHVSGRNDKADAVLLLIDAYRQLGPIRSIGLGDGPNDAGFLNLVDHPVLLDSPAAGQLVKRVPRAHAAPAGPSGWNEAILGILDRSPGTNS